MTDNNENEIYTKSISGDILVEIENPVALDPELVNRDIEGIEGYLEVNDGANDFGNGEAGSVS